MGLERDATEGAWRAGAAKGGGIDKTDVVFGGEAEVLAMLTVLETKGLLEEGGGEGVVVIYRWFTGGSCFYISILFSYKLN